MEAREKELKFLATEGKVIIPFFQRTYVWENENWENLLEGLLSKPEGHFLGSIILKQLKTSSGEPKKLEVIDGQQRLTTLSILIKVLYDLFSDDLKKNSIGEIRQVLFSKISPTSRDYYIKIEHSQIDKEAYENVIKHKIDDDNDLINIEFINEKSHRIYQCYKYFYETLKEKSEREREELFNKILNSNNKMLVVIDLDEAKDDEQAIFDTLNTSGVRLTTAEIIKNALFQKVTIFSNNKNDTFELYKKTWEKTFLYDDDSIKFWETEKQTGRLKRDNLEILLHSIAIIKGFFDPDKNILSELSKLYKRKICEINSKKELEEFISEIITYANIYREKFPTFENSFLFSFNDINHRIFHILEVLEISTFHPFILFVFKKYQNDEANIKNILTLLEKFIIRRMIARQSTKNYNKNCKEFINNPQAINEKLQETTDDDVYKGLQSITNKNATLLLFWIELYRRSKDNKFDTKELKYTYSLEHIMPQKWEEYWNNIPEKYNPDGSKMTPEDAKKDRNDKIYWIGNMTLLRTSLNSALRNYEFEKKMNGEGQKKGIKAYADLSITKDDIVAPFEQGDKVWNEEKIISRTNKIWNEIKEIWGI